MSEELQREGLQTLNRLIETNQLQLIWLTPIFLTGLATVLAVILGVAILSQNKQDHGGQQVLMEVLKIYGAFITTLQAVQTTVAALKDAQQQGILRHEVNSGKMDQVITSNLEVVASNETVAASVDALAREIQNYSKLATESTTNFQEEITSQIQTLQRQQQEINAFIEADPHQFAGVKETIEATVTGVIAQLTEAGRLLPPEKKEVLN